MLLTERDPAETCRQRKDHPLAQPLCILCLSCQGACPPPSPVGVTQRVCPPRYAVREALRSPVWLSGVFRITLDRVHWTECTGQSTLDREGRVAVQMHERVLINGVGSQLSGRVTDLCQIMNCITVHVNLLYSVQSM